jgi:hypothetical protein
VRTRRPRRRSARGMVLELALTLGVVVFAYLWLTNGGPEWMGQWFADAFRPVSTN